MWFNHLVIREFPKNLRFVIFLILALFSFAEHTFAQKVKVQIESPQELKGRKAILSTCERGFAATVHSVKLGYLPLELEIDPGLVPDLYQLYVSQVNGSLFFFLEPGTKIKLDTTDLSKSIVTNSKSNPEWKLFYENIQQPSDDRIKNFSKGERRARKASQADSLNFYVDKQTVERQDLLKKTGEFILDHPASFVSLYLLKANWYAFKNQGVFEKLDASLAGHKNYSFLKGKSRSIVRN